MSEAPRFFLPASSTETAEADFATLAAFAKRAVPTLSQRVYSITYLHNGVEWTATVGEALQGIRSAMTRGGNSEFSGGTTVSDPAVVLAIFPGDPYLVVTNHDFVGSTGSRWENPFMAGRPLSVRRFAS
ncbi:MAG TPA: hypothetical protein VGE51_10395 [Fontimonas sp.]